MKYWFEERIKGEKERNHEELEATDLAKLSIERGFANSEKEYYNKLKDYAIKLAKENIEEKRDPAANLVNAVRSLETLEETKNKISERIRDWEENLGRKSEPHILRNLSELIDEIEREKEEVRSFIKEEVLEKAPNLCNICPPLLVARLIEKAGGMEELAKMPSSTVQVLGAENALFRHLKTGSPPPKHGIIYLHPEINNLPKGKRGKASRILAGKLSIASRIDYYSGELNQNLKKELEKRLEEV